MGAAMPEVNESRLGDYHSEREPHLIQEQDSGPSHKRPGYGDALLLASRQGHSLLSAILRTMTASFSDTHTRIKCFCPAPVILNLHKRGPL